MVSQERSDFFHLLVLNDFFIRVPGRILAAVPGFWAPAHTPCWPLAVAWPAAARGRPGAHRGSCTSATVTWLPGENGLEMVFKVVD